MPTLCLILGDQLSLSISSLKQIDKPNDLILMAEVVEEATYVKHHKKKIAFVFSAMRHFARELKKSGYRVEYQEYTKKNISLKSQVKKIIQEYSVDRIVVTEPGEYRLLKEFQRWPQALKIPVDLYEDTRFVSTKDEFVSWADGKKKLIMEYWYRLMRKKTGFLMEDDKPVGGKWNFDKSNRKPLKNNIEPVAPLFFRQDKITRDVLRLVETEFSEHFGDSDPFWFAVTSKQASKALAHFIEYQLPLFGDYQDAMQTEQPFLYHSVLSHYINAGLLDPIDVCEKVEQAYIDKFVPLNAAEGFIRQIIGWREFIRGIYWYSMPGYYELNYLDAKKPLPSFYWTADTGMNCIANVVESTRIHAYSHHIQRLMITGNFANLAGLDVKQVCEWYLAVYADAYEWVELPNTLGMALHADGGIVGTKPYISSGSYIKRMSNFCDDCQYQYNKRIGDNACPFTNLYWHYLIKHEQIFKDNPRMKMSYRNLQKFDEAERKAITDQAETFLRQLK